MNARVLAAGTALFLAACATPPPPPPPPAGPAPEAMVASVRAAAGTETRELDVQPLRDSMVEDLRREAAELERSRHLYRASADALDRAIAIQPDDPALLQERAEAALLLRDFEGAETLALRAYAHGAQVGPLCRRHWATVEQVRMARGDAAGAAEARTKLDACTVAPPPRY